ncbi:hypothetical protein [Enterovirga rhinocerotis]|uniref:hypothetical protein n=1 Tax=Enterovirga rhinocerotis TaxID=1339210 RepID=UPI00105B57F2|nr:hypothetical protein [Enterovirga rhinocerotis]
MPRRSARREADRGAAGAPGITAEVRRPDLMDRALGGPWSVTLIGDIGGFDAGSRLTWQGFGSVNYDVNENWVVRAGYRALHVDYRKGNFLYDTTMHGPILATTYRF